MRKAILIVALFTCACNAVKIDPQELRDFKEGVCPAAFNGLRALNQERVMNQENFKDTTVMEDLREVSSMLVTIVQECAPGSTHDTLPVPQKFENVPDSLTSPALIASR